MSGCSGVNVGGWRIPTCSLTVLLPRGCLEGGHTQPQATQQGGTTKQP